MKNKHLFIRLCYVSFFLCALKTKSQVTHPVNTNFIPGQYVGLLSQPFTLDIAHRGTRDIRFYTGGIAPAFQRMTIKGTGSGVTTGFIGIGTNFISPLNLLDIRNGSVNVGLGIGREFRCEPAGL